MPRGFESGLRYFAPALILGLVLLPAVEPLRGRLVMARQSLWADSGKKLFRGRPRGFGWPLAAAALLFVIAIGYPVQRHYLESRYEAPSFTAPGLNAAFAWARDVSDARIATTSTRQYPLFGTDLSNHVQYLGTKQPHGGFEPPTNCRQYLQLLNDGNYDYVVATRDRLEPGRPSYPPQAAWTAATGAKTILKTPPTVVYELTKRLDPSAC